MSALVLDGAARHGADAAMADRPATLARYRTFHTLDALRGVAAITVVLFHAAFFFGIAPPAEGYLAVDLFFVMSGFIIAHRYEDDLRRGLGLRGFLAVRLIRLYPLFLLGTLLGALPAVVAIATHHAEPVHRGLFESLPLAVFMLPSPFALPHLTVFYPLNYVSWSLALEILVNIAYAATFRIWSLPRLVALVAVAAIGLLVAAWSYGSLNVGYDWGNAPGGLPRILYGFGMGILLFRLHAARSFAARVPWWVLPAITVAIFFIDPLRVGPAWIKPFWDVTLVTILVPAIVIGAIAAEPPKALRGGCALAGVFSYVVYSIHAPFVGLFLRGEERFHLDLNTTSPAKAAAFTVLLVALCVAAHLGYDKPIRSRLARLRSARRAAATQARVAAASERA